MEIMTISWFSGIHQMKEKKMNQLNIFSINEPDFYDLTLNWLVEYLNIHYPEMKFKIYEYFGEMVVGQTQSSKIVCQFNIVDKDKNDKFWRRKQKRYIGISARKKYGDFEGMGCGLDSIQEFKTELCVLIPRCKKWIAQGKMKEKNEYR